MPPRRAPTAARPRSSRGPSEAAAARQPPPASPGAGARPRGPPAAAAPPTNPRSPPSRPSRPARRRVAPRITITSPGGAKWLGTRRSTSLQQADHPDRRGGVDRAGRALVVEGDVAAGDRGAERAAGVADAAARLPELEEDLGLLRIAEVEAVGDAERPGAGAGDVARRLGHRGLAALVGVEGDVAARCSRP